MFTAAARTQALGGVGRGLDLSELVCLQLFEDARNEPRKAKRPNLLTLRDRASRCDKPLGLVASAGSPSCSPARGQQTSTSSDQQAAHRGHGSDVPASERQRGRCCRGGGYLNRWRCRRGWRWRCRRRRRWRIATGGGSNPARQTHHTYRQARYEGQCANGPPYHSPYTHKVTALWLATPWRPGR